MAGAGIQADIKVALSQGCHALTAVTSVTAQNSMGLKTRNDVASQLLAEQLNCITEDVFPDAIKIGMIGNETNGEVIADFLSQHPDVPVVVDPVMTASRGGSLSDGGKDLLHFYITKLIPMATVVTPNIPEARILMKALGIDAGDEVTADTSDLARSLTETAGWDAVIVKGGHSASDNVSDSMAWRRDDHIIQCDTISFPRIECKNLHGTGCTYSSLLACRLAKGDSLPEAFAQTGMTMSAIIARSRDISLGSSDYGPLNLTP